MKNFNLKKIGNFDIWSSPTLMSWMSYAARSLSLVGILPLILNKFPAEEIVLWYLFSTMISLQMLADYGLRQTFARIISYAFAGAKDIAVISYDPQAATGPTICNEPLLASLVSSMKFLYKWLTLTVFILLIVLGSWAMKKPIENTTLACQGWIAWGIFVVSSMISFYSKVYQNFLEGLNKIALVRKIETLTSLGGILCSLMVLTWAPSLLNLVIVNQFWIIVASVRDWFLCQKTESCLWKRVDLPLATDRVLLKKIWQPVWKSAVSGIMSGGMLSLSSVVYAQYGSKISVASFLLSVRLISQIRDVSMAPFYSKIPVISKLRVHHKMKELTSNVKRGMKLSHFVFVFGFIMTTICIGPFLNWIHSEVDNIDMRLWFLLGLAFFAHRFGSMHLQVYLSTNHVISHLADGVSGGIFIVVACSLSTPLGVYCIPIGMLSGYLFFYCWYCSKYSYKSLGDVSFWPFEKDVSLPAIAAFLLFSLFYFTLLQRV